MAFTSEKFTLTADTRTLIAAHHRKQVAPGEPTVVLIDNSSDTTVYIGGSTVTDGTNGTSPAAAADNTGFPVKASSQVTVVLNAGELLYAFCHSASKAITVLRNGQ